MKFKNINKRCTTSDTTNTETDIDSSSIWYFTSRYVKSIVISRHRHIIWTALGYRKTGSEKEIVTGRNQTLSLSIQYCDRMLEREQLISTSFRLYLIYWILFEGFHVGIALSILMCQCQPHIKTIILGYTLRHVASRLIKLIVIPT